LEEHDETSYVQAERQVAAEQTAGLAVYLPLLEKLLIQENSRKSSLEQRGSAVITTSGVLVSLIFALAAVVVDAQGFALPGVSRMFLIVALTLFVLAAVAGIISNWPLSYQQIRIEDMHRLVSVKNWHGPPEIAAQRVAESRVAILERARRLNRRKARAVLVAMILQILAVIGLAASVTVILIETP
jgi:hypothetical protein